MIQRVRLVNFKSHKDTSIGFGSLTLLCGANGVGKSSIIQILLLLREAFLKDKSFNILDLKSNPVKIGTANDAIYQFGEFDGIQVYTDFDEIASCNFHYEAQSAVERAKSFINLNIDKTKGLNGVDISSREIIENELKKISLFNYNFQYISAARKGPQESYPKDDKIIDVHRQISVIEGEAEYFAHFLDRYRNDEVIGELCYPNSSFRDLFTQVVLWERYIFEGANADIQDVGKLGYLLKFSFDVQIDSKKKTDEFDAKNVGFGLTYVLPLLIAILSSAKGAIIIIENPEAHLHPGAIAKLTELICIAAQAGIQIILETHSDHVINGVLVQTKKFDESSSKTGISRDNVQAYQFNRDEFNNSTIVDKIKIEDDGRIYDKPAGFFDQIANDLRELM